MPELRDSRGVIRVPVRVLSPRHRMQIRHQENLILAAKGKQPVHIAKALFLIYPRILIINKKPVAERHAQQIHPGFLQEKEILLRKEIQNKGIKKTGRVLLPQHPGKGFPDLFVRSRKPQHKMLHIQPGAHAQPGKQDGLSPVIKFFSIHLNKIHNQRSLFPRSSSERRAIQEDGSPELLHFFQQ